MPKDDLKVWSRHIYVQKLEPSMTNLLRWMDKEMTARLRSGAAVQKIGSLRSSVSVLERVETYTTLKMSTETKVLAIATWVRRLIMSTSVPGSRLWRPMNGGKLWIEEQKACFSCLKKGKGHTTAKCFRMKECFEKQRRRHTLQEAPSQALSSKNSSPVQVSSLQEKGKSLLPVLMYL